MENFLACNQCGGVLGDVQGALACLSCHEVFGIVEEDIAVFDGAVDKEDFFDKQAVERLSRKYEGFDRETFLDSIKRRTLWEMDEVNKKVGIAQKLWWEPYIGKVKSKTILELGCGVNYLVPYWLFCGNKIVAFDICKESVVLLRKNVRNIGVPEEQIAWAVADARTVDFNQTFDIININNVLHHIDDKKRVLSQAFEWLADDGKLLIVEPNYYYPPRWIVETDVLDPFNFVKDYFVRNDLLERGEKGVVFSALKSDLAEAGFQIEENRIDDNYLGYFTTYWLGTATRIARVTFELDRLIFSKLLPRIWAPFEYIVATKS